MIRLPSLPFASSIAAGEHHAGLTSDNDAIFNLEYFVGLHKIHHDDIPQVLTEKLAQELMECAHNMHKDLTTVLLEHMQNMEAKGIVCMPAIPRNKKGTSYITAAYHYNEDVDGVDVVVSFMNGKSKEANAQIDRLPQYVPTAHVIPSSGCKANPADTNHFNAEGYRELGRRYGQMMLQLLGF